jgi:hypothetical protein
LPFINGQYYITPTAAVILNSSNFGAPSSTSGLGLLLIGPATDGKPNTPITISSPQQALNILKGGDLCQACILAFSPSDQVAGVNSVIVLRPELATQATSTIGSVISLLTTSYGLPANLTKWMVQSGSVSGYKVSLASDFIGPGGANYPPISQDNIALTVLSIYYNGVGTSPKYTVSDTQLVLSNTGGTGLTVTFTSTMTVQQLVNQINGTPGWVAVVLDPNANDLVTSLFDYVGVATSINVAGTPTPTMLTANVDAVMNWINSTESYFTAVRQANSATVTTSSTWTYATGGTTPTAANADWQACYTTAQALTTIGVVTPVIGSASVWAMNNAHCSYMTGLGIYRIGYVGDISGQSLATEVANAAALNSEYTSMVWPEQYNTDISGTYRVFAPYLIAAQVAGARAGSPPPIALTNAALTSSGMAQILSPAQVAQANAAGIACLKTTPTGTVVLSWDRTTWLQNTSYSMVENLSHLAAGIIIADLQATLDNYKGPAMTPQRLGHLQSDLFSRLTYWYQNNLIAVLPQLSDVQLTCTGQIVLGSAGAAIIVPTNYLVLTLNAVAFSGSTGTV